jgi:hypothetical protein
LTRRAQNLRRFLQAAAKGLSAFAAESIALDERSGALVTPGAKSFSIRGRAPALPAESTDVVELG